MIPRGCVPLYIFIYLHIYLLCSQAFCLAVLEEIAVVSDMEAMRHTEDLSVIPSIAARPWRGPNMPSAKHLNSPDADRKPHTTAPVREAFRAPLRADAKHNITVAQTFEMLSLEWHNCKHCKQPDKVNTSLSPAHNVPQSCSSHFSTSLPANLWWFSTTVQHNIQRALTYAVIFQYVLL